MTRSFSTTFRTALTGLALIATAAPALASWGESPAQIAHLPSLPADALTETAMSPVIDLDALQAFADAAMEKTAPPIISAPTGTWSTVPDRHFAFNPTTTPPATWAINGVHHPVIGSQFPPLTGVHQAQGDLLAPPVLDQNTRVSNIEALLPVPPLSALPPMIGGYDQLLAWQAAQAAGITPIAPVSPWQQGQWLQPVTPRPELAEDPADEFRGHMSYLPEVTPEGMAIDYMTCMMPLYSNDQYPLPPIRPGTYRHAVTGALIQPADLIPLPHLLIIEPWGNPTHESIQRVYAQDTDNGAECWPGRD